MYANSVSFDTRRTIFSGSSVNVTRRIVFASVLFGSWRFAKRDEAFATLHVATKTTEIGNENTRKKPYHCIPACANKDGYAQACKQLPNAASDLTITAFLLAEVDIMKIENSVARHPGKLTSTLTLVEWLVRASVFH